MHKQFTYNIKTQPAKINSSRSYDCYVNPFLSGCKEVWWKFLPLPKSSKKPLVFNLFSRWRHLFMSTAPSLHCSRTLWTVPFPFWCFCQSNTSIMEPLNGAILVITAYHFTIGHLITNAVTWLIWIIGPVNLAIGIRLWYYCCLLR